MTRKPYAKEIAEWMEILREDESVIPFRISAEPPDHSELGDIFEQIYRNIEAAGDQDPIARAFYEADLQIENPIHWFYLMRVFCDLHFPARKRSISRKRTPSRMRLLQKRRSELARDVQEKLPKAKEAELLRKKYPEDYGGLEISSVRRMIAAIGKRRRSRAKPKSKAKPLKESGRRDKIARFLSLQRKARGRS